MDARTTPFTHMRHARGYRAEREMLEALERHDDRAERMLDRMLRALGADRDPSPQPRQVTPVA